MTVAFAPHYSLVPKDLKANLKWRREVMAEAEKDEDAQRQLRAMCRQDPLFTINTFYWTYDPRLPNEPVVPFITYDFQDQGIRDVFNCVTKGRDMLWVKSRAMGASWTILSCFHHMWMFKKMVSFLLMSRKEDLVDRIGDYDSLFGKLDLINTYLPLWLTPQHERRSMHLRNLETGGIIDGESTNADAGRGGRRNAIMMDEFAAVDKGDKILMSTMSNTNCRIYNSTPKGTDNAFYDLWAKEDTSVKKVALHWKLHPVYSKDAYTDEKGKLRSPWYDDQVSRCSNPQEIAQELDMDFMASDYTFFNPERITELKKQVQRPVRVGELETTGDGELVRFVNDTDRGRFRLWVQEPDPSHNYFVGCDISAGTAGTKGSNSTLSIFDRDTNTKVGEFAAPDIMPHKMAELAVAVCKWFRGPRGSARLIWDGPGFGLTFGQTVLDLGFRNIFWAYSNEQGATKKLTDKPGAWYNTPELKLRLLSRYREALFNGNFINLSYEALDECVYFVYERNTVVHAASTRKEDPSGAGHNHGDRVIADALVWLFASESRMPVVVEQKPEVTPNCFAYRQQKRRSRQEDPEVSYLAAV